MQFTNDILESGNVKIVQIKRVILGGCRKGINGGTGWGLGAGGRRLVRAATKELKRSLRVATVFNGGRGGIFLEDGRHCC